MCCGRVAAGGIDLFKVLSVYNFSFWFDGRIGVVFLGDDAVALVDALTGEYRVYSTCSGSDYESALYRVLGVSEDVKGFFSIAERDELLSDFARAWRGWRLRSTTLWWGLVIGVCQQNASFRQGWKMLYNIVVLYGRRVFVEGRKVPAPPTPNDILRSPEKLKEARVGYRARTILEVAKAIKALDENSLAKKPEDSIEKELLSIRGIGPYTARLAIALALRKYSLAPFDRWLRKIAAKAYGIQEEEAEKHWHMKWREWSALAAIATTIALDAEPLTKALRRIEEKRLLPENQSKPTPATLWKYEKL